MPTGEKQGKALEIQHISKTLKTSCSFILENYAHEKDNTPPLARHIVSEPDVILNKYTLKGPGEDESEVDEEVDDSTTSAKTANNNLARFMGLKPAIPSSFSRL